MTYLLTNFGLYLVFCVIYMLGRSLCEAVKNFRYWIRHRNDPFPEPWTPDDEDKS